MRNFPLFVQNRLNEFKPEYRQAFLEEFDKKKKSVFVAYLLLIPLGWHYAYLKRWGSQILCIVTFWGLLLWWILDFFRLPSLVRKYNDELSMDIIKGYNWVSSNPPTTRQKEEQKGLARGLNNMSIHEYYRLKNRE